MAYTYDRLNNDRFETRLLMVEPANNAHDPIRISLDHVFLDSEPKYFALSYTWGRPSPRFPDDWDDPQSVKILTVNGETFEVRYNLFSALHTIRQTWRSNTVWWIDAICIDQKNIPERSQQVANMWKIYASSAGTVVWLGPADATTHMAFSKIASLSASWNERTETLKQIRIPDESLKEYIHILRGDFSEEDPTQFWEALQHLLTRAWFERAWVVQEVCVAPSALVQCGDCISGWTALLNTRQVIIQHFGSIGKAANFEVTLARGIVTYLFTRTQTWQNLEETILKYRNAMTTSARPSLITFLNHLRPTLATDPRDKVYSAFGLATIQEQTPIDYSLPVETVYARVAQKSIQVTQYFHILAYCVQPPKLEALPSWVPDWSDNGYVNRIALPQKGFHRFRSQTQKQLYHTAGDSDFYVRFEDNGRTMIVKAILLDEIAFTSTNSGFERNDAEQTQQKSFNDKAIVRYAEKIDNNDMENNHIVFKSKWLREWAVLRCQLDVGSFPLIYPPGWSFQPDMKSEIFEDLTYKPTKESLREAYLRTLAADVLIDSATGHEVRLPDSAEEIAQTLFHELEPAEAASIRLEGRAFAVSKAGFIALTPAEARVHDLIAVVQGSEIPFILRPSELGFNFIGQAYVHGIMDGEFWSQSDEFFNLSEIRII